MFLALILRRGMASGNRVKAHITVSEYWFPALVLGNGPTQSTITLLKGSSTAGIGCSGATGTFRFGFPTSWHMWQDRQNCCTSLLIPGQ